MRSTDVPLDDSGPSPHADHDGNGWGRVEGERFGLAHQDPGPGSPTLPKTLPK